VRYYFNNIALWPCFLGLLLLGLLLLGACSNSGGRGPTSGNISKNGVTLGIGLEPPGLDPTRGAAAATDEIVYTNVFEGLTRIDSEGKVQPALAKSWVISEDALTYEFQLQQSIRFHDGSDFDAYDVKFSLDRARADGSVNAQIGLFSMIEQVDIIDQYKIKISLSRRTENFLFNLAWGDAVIVAPESADRNHSHPIGTGAFLFSRWQKGQSIRLERNPDYWGKPSALDWVVFTIIPDSAAAYAALISGDVNGFPNFPAPELLPQIAKNPRFNIVSGVTEGETVLGLNNKRPPFDNIEARKAVVQAIDRGAIIEGAMFGQGQEIGSFFSPLHPAYIDLTQITPYNLDQARQRLKEAGYEAGFEVRLKLPPPQYARRSGEVIAAQLAEIGITAKIQYMEWAQWLDQVLGQHDFDMTIVSHTEPRDLSFFARTDNYFGYDNPDFTALMAAAEGAKTTAESHEVLRDAQRLLTEDAASAFLFQLPLIGVWDKRIHGYWKNSPIQANDMTGVYRSDRVADTDERPQ